MIRSSVTATGRRQWEHSGCYNPSLSENLRRYAAMQISFCPLRKTHRSPFCLLRAG